MQPWQCFVDCGSKVLSTASISKATSSSSANAHNGVPCQYFVEGTPKMLSTTQHLENSRQSALIRVQHMLTSVVDMGCCNGAQVKYAAALDTAPPAATERAIYFANRAACALKLREVIHCIPYLHENEMPISCCNCQSVTGALQKHGCVRCVLGFRVYVHRFVSQPYRKVSCCSIASIVVFESNCCVVR